MAVSQPQPKPSQPLWKKQKVRTDQLPKKELEKCLQIRPFETRKAQMASRPRPLSAEGRPSSQRDSETWATEEIENLSGETRNPPSSLTVEVQRREMQRRLL